MTQCKYCNKKFQNLDSHLQKNKVCHSFHILPDEKKPFCYECKVFTKKINPFFDYYLCINCHKKNKYELISKSKAKSNYLLSDIDLQHLTYKTVPNPHYSSASRMILFLKSDIITLSQKIHSNINDAKKKRQEKSDKRNAIIEKKTINCADEI